MTQEYHRLLKELFSRRQSRHSRADLERVRHVDNRLGGCSQAFTSIHIAGTNGKGSVATKVAKGLQLAGKCTGLYTSPHIVSFRERMVVDGEQISRQEVIDLAKEIFAIDPDLTFFEIATLMAFKHFSKKGVEVAVLEVGLGGRLDATNIVTPALAIITSISMDHTDLLGDTLEKIAAEKAGIIKPGVPVIIGSENAAEVLIEKAEEKSAPIIRVDLSSPFSEEKNQAIARAALEQLQLPEAYITEALKAVPPCRQEIVATKPIPIIFDVAHNPSGIEALFYTLRKRWLSERFQVVCGFSKSKDAGASLEIIHRHAAGIHLVQGYRGTPTEELVNQCYEIGATRPFQYENINAAFSAAKKMAVLNKQPLVVCGSFYLLGSLREDLRTNKF